MKPRMLSVIAGTHNSFARFQKERHAYGDVIPGDALKHTFNSINNSCREADIHVNFHKNNCTEPMQRSIRSNMSSTRVGSGLVLTALVLFENSLLLQCTIISPTR